MRIRGGATLALLVLAAAPLSARSQEWTDTRVGNYDFICESLTPGSATPSVGTFVSGHQRFSLAARSCAAAKAAHPELDYQVRPATYRIALVAAPAPPTTPTPSPPAFALGFDPTCSALQPLSVSVGTAFVTPPLASCFTGGESATATFSVLDASGAAAPHGWAIDANSGALSNPGTGPQGSGSLLIRRTTASGVNIDFVRNWSVQ